MSSFSSNVLWTEWGPPYHHHYHPVWLVAISTSSALVGDHILCLYVLNTFSALISQMENKMD